ncbi:MAG: 50S ribosomal protein L37ae [Candidatus Marsarchaeota archaeon]|jgi:large subunit ribosomal protein L37Ae|nr:50S ribosomal protein L37ae [Candidatus Marsarchaeota archaeon]MCL5419430.1 50S ribosomal protein L37ae [Candidatus Marsarchaeota archaeon]
MANSSIRYGVSLRKRFRAVANEKKAKYKCDACGKVALKRVSQGIWHCNYCNATVAGGAYNPKTAAGETASIILSRIASGQK